MFALSKFWRGVRAMFRKQHGDGELDAELDEELRDFVERSAVAKMQMGLSRQQALREARVEMGSMESVKERVRAVGWETAFHSFWQDVRFALRMLRKSPGFAAIVVLTLALGIGANTAIFSLVNAFYLRPLPGVSHPEQLATLVATGDGNGITVAYAEYKYYRDHNRVFSGLAAYRDTDLQLGSGGDPERVQGAVVSSNYFTVLGARFALGRWFSPEEDQTPGAFPVVVISYKLWNERFHADPGLLGKSVILNGHAFTVVGVAAKDFQGIEAGESLDIWTPLAMYGEAMPGVLASFDNGFRWLGLIGRRAAGVSMNQAQADMRQLMAEFDRAHPGEHETGLASVVPQFRFELDSFEAILFAAVGFLLLIACANVANLLLVQSSMRKGEFAVRQVLGASRGRLAWQLLVEGLLISLFGCAAALLTMLWVPHLILPLLNIGGGVPAVDLEPDVRVLGFALAISVLSSIGFTLAPAAQAAKRDLIPALNDSAAGAKFGKSKLHASLVIVQISLSIVLLVGADLLLRALGKIDAVKPDFETKNILLVSVQPGMNGYNEAQLSEFYWEVQQRVESLPGVRAAGLATDILAGNFFVEEIAAEGHEPPVSEPWTAIHYDSISPGYFHAMSIPILRGREFDWGDTAGSPKALVLNESASRDLFGAGIPVGRMVHLKGEREPREVVGLVKDVWYPGLWENPPANIYFPLMQDHPWPLSAVTIHVWTKGDPRGELPSVKRAVGSVDKSLPVYDVRTMNDFLQQSLWALRTANAVVAVVGLLALLMAAVGVYGVISYGVTQRTREIGVRMALGAQPGDVLRMVIREGMLLAGVGIVTGICGALALTRFLQSLLFEIKPTDPTAFGSVVILLIVVALAACYIPARRAMRIEPMEALRYE